MSLANIQFYVSLLALIKFLRNIDMEIGGTIAAIATPIGAGGIAIVRVSGADAVDICQKIVMLKHQSELASAESHKLNLAVVKDLQKKEIDKVLVCVMKAPRSYTGEDVVEIHCHGGSLLAKIILSQLISCGARLARGGEFTFRAVMNGKINLAQAEAVNDVIKAKSLFQLRSATQALEGKLSGKIECMMEKLLDVIAEIAGSTDFPDEVEPVDTTDMLNKINDIIKEVDEFIINFQKFDILREGIKTVITGKPNVGKSSLMNALTKIEKAIVTSQAGTTRDAVEERIDINGVSLHLIDTAGIRETEDMVEIIGIERAKRLLIQAHLILMVVDASQPLDEQDTGIIKYFDNKKIIVVLNKIDLSHDNFMLQKDINFLQTRITDCEFIRTTLQGEIYGVDQLEKLICDKFELGAINEQEICVCNMRQYEGLLRVKDALNKFIYGTKMGISEDILVVDLEQAVTVFGEIIGATVQQQVIDKIFSNFCVGK